MSTKAVTDESFATDVLESDVPVLVDFWAEWCGPCKQIAPILDEASKEYEGKLQVAKVDIDANPATPTQYGVRGIPTVMLFKGGTLIDSLVGSVSKQALYNWIDDSLSSSGGT